jgi:cysteine desulfurase
VRTVYLDNNATTAVAPEVTETMLPFLTDLYGNPSSMHTFGGQVGRSVDIARDQVASLLGARSTEIVFTSCGTESDSFAIRGVLEAKPERRHIVTTRVEHPAIRNLARILARRNGCELTEVAVDREGRLDLAEIESAIRKDTAIVSVMYANNETGVVFPVEKIGAICREKGVPFHVDGVQAAGKIPLDMQKSNIDLLSISGHKLHAPKGVGALYVRRGTRIRPFLVGGHQERGRRAGTEAVPQIVAMGKACELAGQGIPEKAAHMGALRDRLEKGLLSSIDRSILNGHTEERVSNTTNISFEFVEGEAILLMLDKEGICASSGSACTSGSLEPSHVLRSMGVPFTYAHGSVRLSLSRYTVDEDVDAVLEHLPPIIRRLREISPFSADHVPVDPSTGGSEGRHETDPGQQRGEVHRV